MLATDGDRVLRKSVQVVGGTIQRVDDPAVFSIAFDNAGFLGDDTVIGIGLEQILDNSGFGLSIDVTDKIVAGFYFDLQVGYFVDFADDKIPGVMSRSNPAFRPRAIVNGFDMSRSTTSTFIECANSTLPSVEPEST